MNSTNPGAPLPTFESFASASTSEASSLVMAKAQNKLIGALDAISRLTEEERATLAIQAGTYVKNNLQRKSEFVHIVETMLAAMK